MASGHASSFSPLSLERVFKLLFPSPLAVAPVLRNFAAGRPPLFFLRRVC